MDEPPLRTLKQKSRHLQIINELAIDLLHTPKLEPILWLVAKTAIANIGFVDCVIYLLGNDGKTLIQRAAHGPKNPEKMDILNPITIQTGTGIVGQVAEKGVAEIVSDTRKDPRYILDDEMRLSELAVPIIYNNKIIGVIDSEHPQANFYTENHLEVLTIIASMAAMSIANALNQERLMHLSEKLHYDASHDALTGLLNRRAFESELQLAFKNAKCGNTQHVLCYADVNGFKKLNDTYGHAAGDEYLKKIAQILRDCVSEPHVCARLGGDEFSILFRDTIAAEATQVCQDICQQLKGQRSRRSSDGQFTHMSLGVCEFDPAEISINEAVARADAACYAAKKNVESTVCNYVDVQEHIAAEKAEMSLVDWLRAAIESSHLNLFVQEIYPANPRNQKLSYEILLRAGDNAPQFQSISSLLHAAERHGLASRMDHWVVTNAVRWLRKLPEETAARIEFVAVNLSAESVSTRSFQEFLLKKAAEIQSSPIQLCFEITEHVAIDNIQETASFLSDLRRLGCLIALDDFGSGMMSYEYLRKINVDLLKIDGSFVRHAIRDSREAVMLKSINELAHGLNIRTVAEHIEDEKTLQFVTDLGVEYLQGFHLNKPFNISDIESRIAAQSMV
ncbi:MAG: EAL domain-containing protein [Pseudomonadota bacterium]